MTDLNQDKPITISKISGLEPIKEHWDSLTADYFQTAGFIEHLQKYNFCNQRYYLLYESDILKAGAIVYTLPVNLLTFSNKELKIKMNVIGIAASVDSSGIIGDPLYFDQLVAEILSREKGIILCLNYNGEISVPGIVKLQTLPTVIFKHDFNNYETYLRSMRHHYRRRMVQAAAKFSNVETITGSCLAFSDEHYKLYLNILLRSKTKLETLSSDFFKNLNSDFTLTSYYTKDKVLLTWHITCSYREVYSFLFGGINYEIRDEFEGYYNNLLGIIREAIEKGFKTVNLGQTAEIPKMRVGGKLVSKRLFLYHHNSLIQLLLKLFRPMLEYKQKSKPLNVFKHENTVR